MITVRPKFTWDDDGRLVSTAVTLFEGQGDGEFHRLVGGVLHRPVLSLEISLNFLSRNRPRSAIAAGSDTRRRLSFGGDVG